MSRSSARTSKSTRLSSSGRRRVSILPLAFKDGVPYDVDIVAPGHSEASRTSSSQVTAVRRPSGPNSALRRLPSFRRFSRVVDRLRDSMLGCLGLRPSAARRLKLAEGGDATAVTIGEHGHRGGPMLRVLGRMAMMALATGVALHSLRFFGVYWGDWIGVDPDIRRVIEQHPFEALTHILIAPVALLLGPFQFMSRFRTRYTAFHRWAGRIYVLACVLAGVGGFATAMHASGGPVAGLGFGLLAVSWTGTTIAAWWAAFTRNVPLHRVLMRFSYAMTFGAVTLRLQIPLGLAFGYQSYSALSVWLAYTSWIPNVIAVAVYSLYLPPAQ